MSWGLRDQQVNVLRHHHVTDYGEEILAAHRFKSMLEDRRGLGRLQIRAAILAAEGKEVKVAGLLPAFEA
jgi:hypothetical protein